MPSDLPRHPRFFLAGLGLILAIGIFLRLPASLEGPGLVHLLAALHPEPGFTGIGFDENLYRNYVTP